ncbi:uncharacterized protein LOC114880159 [Osmia bicornis bicornis]|uniref:uncharacterized protein LOC114880159 n=1 Tax=Osmia bicornis bicornis TaxID=1437191 RepID=UPI0010F4D98F|nr:uncharacterized protein LOC114880159 [Osmia bicornis bicornis]
MQIHVALLVVVVILVASIESKPIWPNLYVSNYPSEAISVQPQLLQYQDTYSPYYVYNVRTDLNAIPATILANGKPAVPHLPTYNFYYGTPVYDLRFPLNPVYPLLKPGQPGPLPKPNPPSTTTMKPTEESDDGIEKLDTKVEPEKEMKEPVDSNENDDDDSITIDSI